MYEFKYSFDDIANMSKDQIAFLIEGLNKKYKEEEKRMKRARMRPVPRRKR